MEKPYYNIVLDNFFEVLGLNIDASYKEVKSRYRHLAFKYHPDKNQNDETAETKMKEINEAYNILKNETSRINYVKKYGVYTNEKNIIDLGKTYKQEELECIKQSLQKIKDMYKNTKSKEKENTFKQRFKDSYQKIDDEDYFGSFNSIIISEGLKITCVLGLELIYQLSKLKKEKDDTITKYTVRNRKTLAGVLVACMLFNPIGVNAQTEKSDKPNNSTVEEQIDVPKYLIDKQPIFRTYKTTKTDTLEKISKMFNIPLEKLMQVNNLKYDNIRENKVLKIPYYIEMDQILNYTISINVADFKSLEDIAKTYETDLRTIYSLNTECFELIGDKYYQISDTLLVPNFEKLEELSNQKTYQKS